MKLRNKKTSDIIDVCIIVNHKEYRSIEELYEDYEDYTPAEPLIKDEKIRKAVRAWAEANEYVLVKVGYDMASEPNNGNVQIHFEGTDIVDEDKYGIHTITELCGEEEECES